MARAPSSDRETRLARAVLTQNLKVQPGENVIIEGWSHSLPWAVALAREARRLKAFPFILYENEDSYWDSVEAGEDEVLGAAPTHEWAALGKTDVYIHMWGVGDKLRMSQLPAERAERLIGFNSSWYDAAKKAGLRGSRLEIGRPFPSLSKAYAVDQGKWLDQVVEATTIPPKQLEASGAPIAKALARGRTVRIHDDHGTDLKLGLAHREVQTEYGLLEKTRKTPKSLARGGFRVLNSLPAGTVRVSLDESVAEGTIKANRPSYNDFGKSDGGVFRFRKGRLVYHHYDTNPEMFDEPYATGGKGRDRPGYLTIGLNPKLHATPQLEDREAGAITIGVGNNTFLGGKNKSPFSGIVVNVGATLEIDGKRVPLPG